MHCGSVILRSALPILRYITRHVVSIVYHETGVVDEPVLHDPEFGFASLLSLGLGDRSFFHLRFKSLQIDAFQATNASVKERTLGGAS